MSGADGAKPLVSVLMGSKSDWPAMQKTADILTELGIPHESRVFSAHRTPGPLEEYLASAEKGGVKVFIAGAGGAAHLAGVIASRTVLPVLGVPMQSKALQGLDSLLSTVQMPKGIPVATLAIGDAGAANAGLFAAQILGVTDESIRAKLQAHREKQAAKILSEKL